MTHTSTDGSSTRLAWPAGLAITLLLLSGCGVMPAVPGTAASASVVPAAAASAPGANAMAVQSAAAGSAARGVAAPSGAASAAPLPGAATAAAASSGLRPFAEVIKDAKRIDGLFTLWQKDDRVWIELKPDDLNQPFFLSPKYKTGIGEGVFLGGLMAGETVVEFRRIYNQVQMLAKNTEFIAKANTPTGRAVDLAFSPSLLASAAVLSQPHPERKSVLVEVNALFVNDMLGTALALQRSYRQGYVLDPRNSAITAVRATPDLVVLEVLSHFATGSISFAQPGAPPGTPVPTLPRSLPDPRSLFMTLHYSLARLPEHVMPARKADSRIGHFTESVSDFTDDLTRSPRQRFIQRWRLDKRDATAEMSEPVKPITFWLDRTIPEKYRAPITAGVLEWNKAFEKIGFKDALRVEVQADDADWDTLDFGRNSIRWMANANPSFTAIGPRHVDPRSGEILDADIGVESLSFRSQRALRVQVLGAASAASVPEELASRGLRGQALCSYAEQAAEQLSYAMDVLEARGDLDPSSPQAEKFVYDFLKDVTMHEVGHTLGLRHNFRASRVYTDAQLSDPAFTAEHGVSGSVMEYAAINLAAPGQAPDRQGTPFSTTLGPYDYWAIEYAYKPLPAAEEDAELGRIARRSSELWLAYGTDEDNSLGIDPESLQFDLGADVIAFARKRVAIGRDLLARQENRQLPDDQDYSVLRRSVTFALRDMGRAAGALTRQIGGVRTLRDHAGSGRDPLLPVSAPEQRLALDVLTTGFLSADSLRISPALQRKLALDFLERSDSGSRGEGSQGTDFSFAAQVVDLQRGILAQLMSDSVAVRLLDSEDKSPQDALRLSELYRRLNSAVWSELTAGGDIASLRRELQREHVNRLAGLLLRPTALSRADARSLMRSQTQGLLDRIQTAARRGGLSEEAKAHLQDSADTLSQALSARPQRAGT